MPAPEFEAAIFDLDGVITQTALAHSAAWKHMFDEYLKERADKNKEPFREFTHENDYLKYVDGKPRYEGVRSFLESRGIILPWGDPSDRPDMETVCGIGNRKNQAFNKILKEEGVKVYDSTLRLIKELSDHNIRVGVASSSKNCRQVLEAAGIAGLFETRVDGEVSAEQGLRGKPEPDIFHRAADNLGVSYDDAVVIEDAVSGVLAGKNGNFGMVIGIAREGNERELLINGADLVVSDLEEVSYKSIREWFRHGLAVDSWSLTYHDYDTTREKTRETLLTTGNGLFGTRGAMEESEANEINYPGTYMTGVYNRLVSRIDDHEVENEDLVNVINWLPVSFRVDDGDWLDVNNTEILEFRRVLHFNHGILYRKMIVRDPQGRETRIDSKRIVSMQDPHLAALEYIVKPLNYSGKITLRAGLHGDHINAGVSRYKDLNQQHLEPVETGADGEMIFLHARTTRSGIEIAAASNLRLYLDEHAVTPDSEVTESEGRISRSFTQNVKEGQSFTISKVTALFNSYESDVEDPLDMAREACQIHATFRDVLERSERRWEEIWDKIDIRLSGDRLAQKLLRLHLYHLMVTVSPHNLDVDAGIPARGLHGEAYRGHIFWDELFILPLYDIHFPDVARSVLMYRYHRLGEARKNASAHGCNGAMFPWQSGSSGREETQVLHLNPVSGNWGPDYSSLQRHVSLAIAFNIWQYYRITGDVDFLESGGAEMFVDICRFWAGQAEKDEETGRYSIRNVMGPDEFHEKYPDAEEGGLTDNAYTNIMVAWSLARVADLLELISQESRRLLYSAVNLTDQDLVRWDEIARNLRLVISDDGIISQYDGYFDLKELNWDAYRKKYGNIYRMDRLLKAEGKSPDEYKVAKQADTLMTFFNLRKQEADTVLDNMGYRLPEDYLEKNLEYYIHRTSHGSTLSRVVHARLAALAGDKDLSWDLYLDALRSDYSDVQGGTTGEGIHAGVMAGTVWIALNTYAGLDLSGEMVRFEPDLPRHWKTISFHFRHREKDYECIVSAETIRIKAEDPATEHIPVMIRDRKTMLESGEWHELEH